MTIPAHRHDDYSARDRMPVALRAALAALLGVLAAVLISCGGSGAGLIPAGKAGPLQSDFEAVAQAAKNLAADLSRSINRRDQIGKDAVEISHGEDEASKI